jgi:anti-sigma B factor antagonist
MAELGSNGPARATIEGSTDGAGRAVLRVAGELDLSTVPLVEHELQPFLAAAPSCVVFDMSGVAFMDSSGIAMLLRAAEKARVEVRSPSSAVQLVIQATGLAETLHLAP